MRETEKKIRTKLPQEYSGKHNGAGKRNKKGKAMEGMILGIRTGMEWEGERE